MLARLRLLLLAALVLPLTACGDPPRSPEEDAELNSAEVRDLAAAASVRTLEQTVTLYTAHIAELETRLAALDAELRTLDAGQILGPEGTRISGDLESSRRELVRAQRNLQAYTKALAGKR